MDVHSWIAWFQFCITTDFDAAIYAPKREWDWRRAMQESD